MQLFMVCERDSSLRAMADIWVKLKVWVSNSLDPAASIPPEAYTQYAPERPATLLVSIMHVNNETGVVQPIEDIAKTLAKHEAFFHVDAAQAFGKCIADLQNRRIDLIRISGHKIYAPKGIGALVVRRHGYERLPLTPLAFGGGQERGLRPGTLPVALIVALGKAGEFARLLLLPLAERDEIAGTLLRGLNRGFIRAVDFRPAILGHRRDCILTFAGPNKQQKPLKTGQFGRSLV